MKIYPHRNFKKQFEKLQESDKRRFKQRIALFIQDPFHPLLNNHTLSGKYQDYRSINISGDLRALYKPIGRDAALFMLIGTHSELYKR